MQLSNWTRLETLIRNLSRTESPTVEMAALSTFTLVELSEPVRSRSRLLRSRAVTYNVTSQSRFSASAAHSTSTSRPSRAIRRFPWAQDAACRLMPRPWVM